MTAQPTQPRDPWNGRNVQRARAHVANQLPRDCPHCHKPITHDDDWIVGHTQPRWAHPERILDPTNWRPEHRKCSDRSGPAERARIRRAAQAAVAAGLVTLDAEAPPVLAQGGRRGSPAPARTHTPGRGTVARQNPREGPLAALSRPNDLSGCPWLSDLLKVPENAAWPRYMTPPHPDAVGSYGPAAVEWMESALTERRRPLRLRWWQRLAIYRQLEHDADGALCWQVVVESTSRRSGKSLRLRAIALWRMAFGEELFEPEQLVVHTGKDLAIVREVMRKAWIWTDTAEGWAKKQGMTEPEVSFGVNRWIARSKDATTGYDACLALVDEAWDVKPGSIDDDLEPSMLERVSPQILLTSTAHRRATSLMRRRIAGAVSGMGEDFSTLLLLWGAPRDAPIGDPATWRAASPHWSPEREALIRSKFERAMRGEADPEADDPDPIEGFRAQYLNVWPEGKAAAPKGDAAVDPAVWASLAGSAGSGRPDVVAVESWFADGVSVAAAWSGSRVAVSCRSFRSVEEAAGWVDGLAPAALLVGKSLAGDPRWEGCEPVGGTTRQAVVDLRRLVDERRFTQDGDGEVARQVEALRVAAGADGPRVVSKDRADAVKAVAWAVARASEYAPFRIY